MNAFWKEHSVDGKFRMVDQRAYLVSFFRVVSAKMSLLQDARVLYTVTAINWK